MQNLCPINRDTNTIFLLLPVIMVLHMYDNLAKMLPAVLAEVMWSTFDEGH